ncbi:MULTISPECIES: orotate phosphoribosyltransferase [Bacillus cereus group]|uniref:Orotate phosphoribosyltransferase n=1 Tax=Bacillus thuringiensis TaxID=1428 RepID=A0A4R4B6C9_BACTU|nr:MULTISPECIES: orotate phosphoribosyltransferase [Bacillus cereus group]MBE7097454.1 orotate phosphoribosyltransferase [Bacillus cereus]MCC2327090.1 orotate phosphoribosyltransferase [Bacillus wiedmannii]TCW49325.1 orotate phosphoribosyltransferase [Bacillus thuringiensis]TCW49416.1 orotate phosphoribosyltransferase [Bacillus thuringiensis]
MNANKAQFIKFIFEENILKFGDFELKSGRHSPYFFNFGSFDDSVKLSRLGESYASNIIENDIKFDVIFGPAYKGIPISLSASMALFYKHGLRVNYAFNRKEAKNHGEGGNIIGTSLKGKKILAVDDVITSGRTIKETKEIIEKEGGELSAFLVALDREEKALDSQLSALEEASKTYGVEIYAVAKISDVMNYMEKEYGKTYIHLSAIQEYLKLYGSESLGVY